MSKRRLSILIVVIVAAGLVAYALHTRGFGPSLQRPAAETSEEGEHVHPPAGGVKTLELSEPARRNLSLVSKPVKSENYWRSIQVPGSVEDRPGVSDRGVVAPVASVVSQIHISPGDMLKPGDPLYTLKLGGERLQNVQAELFKNTQEIQFTKDQLARLEGAVTAKAVPESKMVELENQLKRLHGAADAFRLELRTQGLTEKQIDDAADGRFVIEITVICPAPRADVASEPGIQTAAYENRNAAATDDARKLDLEETSPTYEVQELKAELGQQVRVGDVLCLLSNHRMLFIEGHAFKREASFLEKTLQNGWPVRVEFTEDDNQAWPPLDQTFRIRHLANSVDAESRTFALFIPLANQSRSYEKDGRKYLVWRFRPGQRVRLHIPIEEMKDVFVLPAAAVAREGPEAFVFRQNGDLFDRLPVHVLYEDRLNVVIANDGDILPGSYLAQGAAASLNRVLKSQNSSGALPPGFHVHADGSVHGAH